MKPWTTVPARAFWMRISTCSVWATIHILKRAVFGLIVALRCLHAVEFQEINVQYNNWLDSYSDGLCKHLLYTICEKNQLREQTKAYNFTQIHFANVQFNNNITITSDSP